MKKTAIIALSLTFTALHTWGADTLQSFYINTSNPDSFTPVISVQTKVKLDATTTNFSSSRKSLTKGGFNTPPDNFIPITILSDDNNMTPFPLGFQSEQRSGDNVLTDNWSVTLKTNHGVPGSINFIINDGYFAANVLSAALASCPDVKMQRIYHSDPSQNFNLYYYGVHLYDSNLSGFTLTLDPQTNNWSCKENMLPSIGTAGLSQKPSRS